MIEQRSEEWFAARVGRLTASRISEMRATIAGGKPAASRANLLAQLVCERLTGKRVEIFESADMRRGTELEPAARAAYEAASGNIVQPSGFVLHPTIKWLGASPDGLIDADGLVEIKCLNAANHIAMLQGAGHSKYIDQVQTQLMCTGRKWCDLSFWHPDFPEHLQLKVIRIEADANCQNHIHQDAIAFLIEVDSTVEKLKKVAA
jgi:putative phage-type endonuclease